MSFLFPFLRPTLRPGLVAAALAGLLLTGAAGADHGVTGSVGAVEVSGAWARASAGAAGAAAAYLEIVNTGPTDDRLLSAASPAAQRVELHTHVMEDGVARMREVPGIDLPVGDTVALAPGGLHIMLMELPEPLVPEMAITLELTFEQAGTLTLEAVPVRPITARDSGGHGDSDGHDHGHGHGS